MARVQVGDQVYLEEGGLPFGAVRGVQRHGLNIYVENAGDFDIRADAIQAIHDGKVVLLESRLGPSLRTAIAHAHTAERR
jgi:hypothetical protein